MHSGTALTRTRILVLALGGALVTALALGTINTPIATAGSTSPICQQYPDLPQCGTAPAVAAAAENPNRDAPLDRAGPSAEQAAVTGTLPFTGYPLNALILLLLLMLVAGLALRGYLALRDRLVTHRPDE